MNEPIAFKFYTDEEGKIYAAVLDIVDLKYLCYQGLSKNTKVFKELVNALNEIDDEENN